MSSQAAVHSLDAIKEFRAVLALYGEDTLSALGAIEAEVRRTALWLQQDRPAYWQDQIKRRREQVAQAKAEVFRRKLAKTENYMPSVAEPMELLRRAEASLQDAEKRIVLVRKWQTAFVQVAGEFHGSTRRLKDLSASDVPRAVNTLTRIIDAVEAYLQVAPPSGLGPAAATGSASATVTTAPAELESIALTVLDQEPPAEVAQDEETAPDTAAPPDDGDSPTTLPPV